MPQEAEYWSDVVLLGAALDETPPAEWICPQRFSAPLAPPSSARLEGTRVDGDLIYIGLERWREHADLLIVEGVGGLLCPLTDAETVADFAEMTGFPLVIVASLKLGAINHTLLTIEVAQRRRLPIAGLLLNRVTAQDSSESSCLEELGARTTVPILGVLPFLATDELRVDHVISTIDWLDHASSYTGPPIFRTHRNFPRTKMVVRDWTAADRFPFEAVS